MPCHCQWLPVHFSCPKCSRNSVPSLSQISQLKCHWSALFPWGPMHISSQSSLPERVWAWGTPPWSRGGVSSPGAQRMQCGHFPKADTGYDYQSQEAGRWVLLPKQQMPVSSLICSDVIFHRSTAERNVHQECHWLVWLWEIWVLFCVFPPRWAHTAVQTAPLPHCTERKGRRRKRTDREGEGTQERTLV